MRDGQVVIRASLLLALVGCAPTAMTVGADHPANASAPTGRLAGPPAALRPGVAVAPAPEPTAPVDHSQHQPPAAPVDHSQHQDVPAPSEVQTETEEAQPKPPKKVNKPRKPAASKPERSKPAVEKPTDPPTPPTQQGHEGHH